MHDIWTTEFGDLNCFHENLGDAIKAANGGKRVNLILEMVGGKTFDDSLEILAPFGRLVTYGMASRVAPSMIQPASLMGGSKTITGARTRRPDAVVPTTSIPGISGSFCAER